MGVGVGAGGVANAWVPPTRIKNLCSKSVLKTRGRKRLRTISIIPNVIERNPGAIMARLSRPSDRYAPMTC